MPKRTPEENEAISKKIKILKAEGLRQDRAIAAAMRMYREGKLKIPKRAKAKSKPKASTTFARLKGAAKVAAATKAASMRKRGRYNRKK